MKLTTLTLSLAIGAIVVLALPACGLLDGTVLESGDRQEIPATQGPAVTGHTPAPQQSQPQTTQSPAGCTNQFVQIGPSNITNGQPFAPGDSFQVNWTIRNVGTCTWTPSYSLVHTFGDDLGAQSPVPLGAAVAPNDTVTLSLQMTAPAAEDQYPSLWKLESDEGTVFGAMQINAPLRVIISVVAAQAPPQQTTEIETALVPPLGVYVYGFEQTMLTSQCYDLVAGQVVSCGDDEADFRYNYAAGQSGIILPLHEMHLAQGLQDAPGKSDCQSESYLELPLVMDLPAEQSTGSHYCFYTERGLSRHHGWLRPVDFNSGGLTFSFVTFEPTSTLSSGEAQPLHIGSLFVMVEADQVTLLTGRCFSLTTGEEVSCSSAEASFSWSSDFSGKTDVKNGTIFSGYTEDDPLSRGECQSEDYSLGGDYYCIWGLYYTCFQTQYGNQTVYGWIRPTHCNANGVTFDFQTFEP